MRGLVAGTIPFSAVDGPGNRYVVFLQGCGWDCLACHNPGAIASRPTGRPGSEVEDLTAADLAARIRTEARFLTGVTVTGGEATLQAEFVRALFVLLAADPATAALSRFVDTNGDASAAVWENLAPVTHGVMVDLKALDDDRHFVLTGASNALVVASILDLAGRGLLAEVRLLFVPGINDDDATVRRTGRWLRDVDPGLQVRVTGMRRHGTRACARDLREPTAADLQRYRELLLEVGLTNLVPSRAPVPGPLAGS